MSVFQEAVCSEPGVKQSCGGRASISMRPDLMICPFSSGLAVESLCVSGDVASRHGKKTCSGLKRLASDSALHHSGR